MVLLVLSFMVNSCKKDEPSPDAEISQIISDAYIYAYPIVMMKVTYDVGTNTIKPYGPFAQSPVNQFVHCHSFADPSYTKVVAPNVDTFYSNAWLDLGQEPMVISVPDATLYKPVGSDWRYYEIELIDAWTNVIGSPGVRTTSTQANAFLISGPKWSGTVPGGMIHYPSPTDLVWVVGRTMIKDTSDLATVVAFQTAWSLMPLSAWPGPYIPPDGTVDDNIDMVTPLADQVNSMQVQEFFQILCDMLTDNPAASYDSAMIKDLSKVGITPGAVFDLSSFPESQQKAINAGYEDGKSRFGNLSDVVPRTYSNGWGYFVDGIGDYGNDYETRAYVAIVGFGANLPEDAVYPKVEVDNTNQPLHNINKYTITFPPGQTPPNSGFWSITMYNEQYFLVENPINRYAVGSYNDLQYNPDNSLTLYIQQSPPDAEFQSNWLPSLVSDTGKFNLMMRIYWPDESILNKEWEVPAVVRVD